MGACWCLQAHYCRLGRVKPYGEAPPDVFWECVLAARIQLPVAYSGSCLQPSQQAMGHGELEKLVVAHLQVRELKADGFESLADATEQLLAVSVGAWLAASKPVPSVDALFDGGCLEQP